MSPAWLVLPLLAIAIVAAALAACGDVAVRHQWQPVERPL